MKIYIHKPGLENKNNTEVEAKYGVDFVNDNGDTINVRFDHVTGRLLLHSDYEDIWAKSGSANTIEIATNIKQIKP